ncbi:hypothetical protein NG99_17015 [Erwinia typographi]|uniref:Uncharacterized protein n=1 Tax=Erwinia typographi TaxID=371042 RepID=A0A0A3Z0V4_9GAMM|nr:hypothetical protein [Erwinia typographi]KGT91266.1 hypothetical protein NG99_17015 [Erwinia typographi]
MTSLIERNRNRVIDATMTQINVRTGTNHTAVNLPDGSVTTIEVTAETLRKALIKLFEKPAYATRSHADAEQQIISNYSACVTRDFDKLTVHGNAFIRVLLDNLVEQAFFSRSIK